MITFTSCSHLYGLLPDKGNFYEVPFTYRKSSQDSVMYSAPPFMVGYGNLWEKMFFIYPISKPSVEDAPLGETL